MKKRVRVYKPGGQTNQPTQEQIVNYISQRMSADDFDGDTDALKAELAQAGVEDAMADDYISYVSDNLGLEDDTQLDEETQLAAEQEQARAQEEEQASLEEQQEAEEEARQAQLAAMYDTNIDMSTTEDTPEDEETYMQYGGAKPSKRSFINKYTKLAKKQMGGDATNHTQGPDTKPAKQFLSAVANTAQDAILKQEAEQAYNSIYGTPQVGAFENGGINPEQIDTESPLDHWTKQSEAMGNIFRNNQNIQNDMPHGQFGGFTDTESGLYKFIGGGDNESADEQYQDADIDFNQESYQMGGFRMPRRSGRQYVQAVNSPYYTATGERAAAPDLVGRQVSSVDVTKRGIFGRPKAYTVNYIANNEYLPAQTKTIPETEKTENEVSKSGSKNTMPSLSSKCSPSNPEGCKVPGDKTGSRQPVADWMMRSGIPGIKQWGANMTKSGMIPEIEAGTEKVIPPTTTATLSDNEPYYPPMDARSQRREARDDAKLNRFLGNTKGVDTINDERIQKKMPEYNSFNPNQTDVAKSIQDLQSQSRTMRKLGGPIDYTEYAYGGDIAIPELHKAQNGVEQSFDPNKNNLGDYLSFKAPEIEDNETFAPPTEDNTIKPLTKEQELLKYQRGYNQQLGYVDPKVAGESISGIGTTDKPILQKGTSEDYQVKRDWGQIGKDVADVAAVGKIGLLAGLDTLDKINARKQENQMLADTTAAESNYGISNEDNRGDYDPNSGLFRPNQMGAMQSKYGGGIYAMGGNTADEDEDVQYMTQEEIDDFLANGGELEYL